jgi:hypothetical protein
LFLVDQSGTMGQPFGGDPRKTKAQAVADAINGIIQELIIKCSAGVKVLDRCYLGAIGYGEYVGLGFVGNLADQVIQPISRIDANPLGFESRGTEGTQFPLWYQPVARGRTPMCQALQAAQEAIADFVRQHPTCCAPIVLNLTDGEANDGNPAPLAMALQQIPTADGNVLLFNAHVSAKQEQPVLFPSDEAGLPDDFARCLFRISSLLPPSMLQEAQLNEESVAAGARGFAFNVNGMATVVKFIKIGTMGSGK